jgi:hypothetical protein
MRTLNLQMPAQARAAQAQAARHPLAGPPCTCPPAPAWLPRQQAQARHAQRAQRGVLHAASVAAPPDAQAAGPSPRGSEDEQGVLDCVVVGAGISGLVTAQAFVSDQADTVRRCRTLYRLFHTGVRVLAGMYVSMLISKHLRLLLLSMRCTLLSSLRCAGFL